MKFGVRKPSLKKSFKARTTGKWKRSIKKSINPYYGKKGMGWIRNPKKALYNKIYRKTTISATDAVNATGGCLAGIFKLMILPFKLILKSMWYVFYLPIKYLFYIPINYLIKFIKKVSAKTEDNKLEE